MLPLKGWTEDIGLEGYGICERAHNLS
jgi:hypothetical protein